jgi:hypothetical protein
MREDTRALAERARASIGADARLDALARMFAMFPDEPAIVVVDARGARIGVVTQDRLPLRGSGIVADLMLALA